ncbi:hypothetical protein F4778DRAFT_772796 [Xylariomycetidae sp. FL2044]|nr:hypothetical protein F4778DRAFT_772796 [Xylariomycetidae sp. FL2044]
MDTEKPDGAASPTSTISTSIPTPGTSRICSISQPASATLPRGPVKATTLSVNSWREPYPQIGQFAVRVGSDEVVAATPDGLVYFQRIQEHPTRPWSQPRLIPNTEMMNTSNECGLDVYCVSHGTLRYLHGNRIENTLSLLNSQPPLWTQTVIGAPSVTSWYGLSNHSGGYLLQNLVSSRVRRKEGVSGTDHRTLKELSTWMSMRHIAASLGVVSAVSVAKITGGLVAGPFEEHNHNWKADSSMKIHHPGKVVGNPVLISSKEARQLDQLDLLVPSAEGSLFHFVRMSSMTDEWHMIARIVLPHGFSHASCLAFSREIWDTFSRATELCAHVQCDGQLYRIKTPEDSTPWSRSCWILIVVPGPQYG